ncbi:uncharacterized protein Z519_10799 [Cladophialophora bantiana CBS 173.52]|uniref:Major facilitator superfamily (MFS) profile domain-containing protein n=1 Tax=Cladophialophora bantiana (strain ATCC 10958 / CBS 173.52 / CDC B-1940 / NIH 8579) TaxID=1442370 RepID=A0A0D2FQ73_CLAB1|nr:uncharacterized protein Z519_10799 [Cladophialophora bantiana CBS 173.52]KIW88752.1 hypothetical protein Z519_10799 [Cladophialophora bantiana CBS 173.52]
MAFGTERHWSAWNFFICWMVSLGQIAFGYPASIIGVTLAQPSFLVYMGLLDVTQDPPVMTPGADQKIGAMSGVFQAGAAINVFIAGYVSDRWGRKAGFHWCGFLSLLGGALLCGSRNSTMFIVARLFAGAGSWGYLAVTPYYSAELAPPGLRGLMVGMNGVNIALGYALASYMGLAFYYVDDPQTQWRAPLGIALIWPVMMVLVCFVIPESPRFLLMKGRIDEARDVVFKLHASKNDPDQEFARGEFYQMSKQAELDRTMEPGWLEMIRRPSYRKRTIMAMGFAFIGQSTGVLVLNNYGPTIYAALGYDTLYQLIFQCGWITVGIFGNLVGALIMDWTGRKPLLVMGVAGCCVSLILEAAMVSSYAEEGTNKAGLRMGVAAAYLFLLVYSIGIDVAGVVFYSELFPNHLRAKGLALSIAVIALTDLVYLQVAATAFANIGWKFYLVFIILSGLGAFFAYFYLPETKNIPLEEMAKLFGDEVAVYAEDLHVDHRTHELIVDEHGHTGVHKVATEAGNPRPSTGGDVEKHGTGHGATTEHVDSEQSEKE